jgi:RNA polymerase sigma-70 factor (ECF subfamily)
LGIQPNHILSEETLVAKLKARERAGMEYLYAHYAQALYGVIARIVKEEEVAEEVLQDGLLKIWEKIDQYDATRARFYTWMLNVVRNLAIDKIRSKEHKQSEKTDGMENFVHQIDRENFAEQNPEAIGLDTLIGQLDPDQQLVVRLVYLEGYTHAEVAETHGIPLGTVKTRLRNALINLRKYVNPL